MKNHPVFIVMVLTVVAFCFSALLLGDMLAKGDMVCIEDKRFGVGAFIVAAGIMVFYIKVVFLPELRLKRRQKANVDLFRKIYGIDPPRNKKEMEQVWPQIFAVVQNVVNQWNAQYQNALILGYCVSLVNPLIEYNIQEGYRRVEQELQKCKELLKIFGFDFTITQTQNGFNI